MEIIRTPTEMTVWSRQRARLGRKIALVPTMGYFHEGHLSLMRTAGDHADEVVVSLFVNPTQFGPQEDLSRYPRDFQRDEAMARAENVAILFAPEAPDMYPSGHATTVTVSGLGETLCGASRPGHFAGVATVVTKLFNIVRPDCAVFGEKDWQQLPIIRRLTTDLNLDVEIIGQPIVRDQDGLALSSRNTYLDETDRRSALSLAGGIGLARQEAAAGVVDTALLAQRVRDFILGHPGTEIDYIAFVDCRDLRAAATVDQFTLLALAVKINNKVRLIDNGLILQRDPCSRC